MMFLMNDTVLRLEESAGDMRVSGEHMAHLSFPAILRMGQELFAKEPNLQRTNPERARRLGLLVTRKAPIINAALFVAPRVDCDPGEVTVRFVSCEFEIMAELFTLQREGRLNGVQVDKALWRRLAA